MKNALFYMFLTTQNALFYKFRDIRMPYFTYFKVFRMHYFTYFREVQTTYYFTHNHTQLVRCKYTTNFRKQRKKIAFISLRNRIFTVRSEINAILT